MKRLICTLGMLAVLAMVLTGLAQAQQFAYRVAADVPTDFYVGGQQFPGLHPATGAGRSTMGSDQPVALTSQRKLAPNRRAALATRPSRFERPTT